MSRKLTLSSTLILFLGLAAAACSGSQSNLVAINTLDTSSSGAAQTTPEALGTAPAVSGASDQFAAGTLKLEGTDLAVTAVEAKLLLPLWQQVKTLTADTSATADQIQAVYDQISGAMTPAQVEAIAAMTFSQADLQSLMAGSGIQVTPGAGLNPGSQGTPAAAAGTRPSGGRGPQGTPGAQGTPGVQGTFVPQGTPGAGMPAGRDGGMNNLFIDAVINLLQQRAG
jgi:hypothetical protein